MPVELKRWRDASVVAKAAIGIPITIASMSERPIDAQR